jgi:hypothetical protein
MKIGNLDITNPKIGTTPINKVYVGNNKVWPNIVSDFIFEIDTTLGDGLNTMHLKIQQNSDIVIHWGDDSTNTLVGHGQSITHTYSTSGIYLIKYVGTFVNPTFFESTTPQKLISIKNWGTSISNLSNCFKTCINLSNINTPDKPILSGPNPSVFQNTKIINGINGWDFSNITNLTNFLYGASLYNEQLILNSSNCTDFGRFLQGATSFNSNLTVDCASVTNNSLMYFFMFGCTNFNSTLTFNNHQGDHSFQSFFAGCSSLTNLNNININLTNINQGYAMFQNSNNFNDDLTNFEFTNLTSGNRLKYFLQNTSFSDSNYQVSLIHITGWNGTTATKTLSSNIEAHFNNARYEIGGQSENARNYLINTLGWTITDGGGI